MSIKRYCFPHVYVIIIDTGVTELIDIISPDLRSSLFKINIAMRTFKFPTCCARNMNNNRFQQYFDIRCDLNWTFAVLKKIGYRVFWLCLQSGPVELTVCSRSELTIGYVRDLTIFGYLFYVPKFYLWVLIHTAMYFVIFMSSELNMNIRFFSHLPSSGPSERTLS